MIKTDGQWKKSKVDVLLRKQGNLIRTYLWIRPFHLSLEKG